MKKTIEGVVEVPEMIGREWDFIDPAAPGEKVQSIKVLDVSAARRLASHKKGLLSFAWTARGLAVLAYDEKENREQVLFPFEQTGMALVAVATIASWYGLTSPELMSIITAYEPGEQTQPGKKKQ